MDFPNQLCNLLSKHKETELFDHEDLANWNEEIETYLTSPPSAATSDPHFSDETNEDNIEDAIKAIVIQLHKAILMATGVAEPFENDATGEKLEELALAVKTRYSETKKEANPRQLFESIRTSKNLLRWYIQIFLERKGRVLPSQIERLQSPALLELLVSILEEKTSSLDVTNQELARNISLYIFYATFSPFLDDEIVQRALNHLLSSLSYTELVLRILTKPCTAALALSLVRSVHNAIASMQGAAKIVVDAKISWDASFSQNKVAPWFAHRESGVINFRSICVDIIRWALFQADPAFPGAKDDKRSDLVIEILGAFYALRTGQELVPSRCDPHLMKLVVDVLNLSTRSKKDTRIAQCKLSMVSLLMDSDPTFGNYIYEAHALTPLLEILEMQITDVLEHTRVDNSAAAALVPILVLLNKYASANSVFREKVKEFIFPVEAEGKFQEKVREQLASSGSKNMGPLDSPKGTIRWKLTTLMTWAESHIKRCTGELLWTICSSDPTEFVHRVGFGNALPILSVKGYAQMPTG